MTSRRDFLLAGAACSIPVVPICRHPLSLLTAFGGTLNLDRETREQDQSTLSDKLSAVETLTKNFLERNGVTAGQIAVSRNGSLLFSRAYGTKPPRGYSAVDNRSLFRIASCSKMFTCAAITRLRSQGELDMGAPVFPLLGIKAPAIPRDKPDPRIDQITIQHLVDHAGGWNDHESIAAKDGTHIPGTEWDPMFAARQISLELHSSRPLSQADLARYMYGKKLQFTPGSQDFNTTQTKSYSNFGYLLLGLVIEKVAGKPYMEFIRSGLNPESDCSNVFLSKLLDSTIHPREVWYVSAGSGPTQLNPASSEILPSAYGGSFIPELHESAGGLMTNAETLALFSYRNAVWGLGGRASRCGRSGSLPGTSSLTSCRANGIDYAYIFNTRDFAGGPSKLTEYTSTLEQHLDSL